MWHARIFGLAILLAAMVSPTVAKSEWRSEIGVFRVGIVSAGNAQEILDRYEPFRAALSDALDIEVEFFRGDNPQSLIDAFGSQRIEYAIFSAFAYALAWNVCECIEPLVSPRAIDSTDSYHLVLVARKSGLSSLNDLAGKSVALLTGEDSAESLLLKGALQEQKVDINSINFASMESGEKTLEAFAAGQFDVLAGWSSMTGNPSEGYSRGTLRLMRQKQIGNPGDYSVLWQSAQIPHQVHVIGKTLPGEAKNILRNLMNNLHDRNPASYDAIEPVYGGGFVSSRHSRFLPLLDVVAAMDAIVAAKQAGQETNTE